MDVAAVLAALVLATVLWAAAIAKVLHPGAIRVTLITLGVPVRASWAAVGGLIAAEASAALLLLVAPRSPVAAAAVLALFGSFALAGALALRSRAPIACACFGSGDGPLGWRQVVQLPLAAALTFLVIGSAQWTAQAGLALSAVALMGIGAWWAIRAWPTWRATRAMRVSLREALMASHDLELEEAAHG